MSKQKRARYEYNRLQKVGSRSQFSPVNDNSSKLENQTYMDSPRRGVFPTGPGVSVNQDKDTLSNAPIEPKLTLLTTNTQKTTPAAFKAVSKKFVSSGR